MPSSDVDRLTATTKARSIDDARSKLKPLENILLTHLLERHENIKVFFSHTKISEKIHDKKTCAVELCLN